MTLINLPNRNVTGDNLWSQVEDNDDAIADVVNGDITNVNIAAGANIAGSKLLAGSIGRGQTKFVLENVTGSTTGAGVQTMATIALAPGKYLIQWLYNNAPQVGTIDTTGGSATLTDLPLIGSAFWEGRSMITVTVVTTLRFRSEAASGSRSVSAYVIGMAD
jgi:hypothetical protein